MPNRRRRLAVVLGLTTLAAVLPSIGTTGAPAAAAPTAAAAVAGPCGSLAAQYDPLAPPVYEHVVVLMEENWSYSSWVASTQTPFLTQLARDCGNETNFHAATHPSQPNYMAATSGVASAVGVKVGNDNIFAQLQRRGRTWKAYEESMPANCSAATTTLYKPGHNPAYWYTNLRTPTNTCARNDVPLAPALSRDIAADALPAYSWITPNRCNIFEWHAGCLSPSSARFAIGDHWLADLLPRLTAMPSYRAGKTLIVVVFDEGAGPGTTNGVDCTKPTYYRTHPDCQIPAVVVSPYIVPGSTDNRDLNLYSLLGTTQDVLGLPRLGRAIGQQSMRPGLRF